MNSQPKQESNIKRRVYDALNVLVASGVINKDKKRVKINQNTNKLGMKFQKRQDMDLKTNQKKYTQYLEKLEIKFKVC